MKKGDEVRALTKTNYFIKGITGLSTAWEVGTIRTVGEVIEDVGIFKFAFDCRAWHFMSEWEVVDDEQDWNLLEQRHTHYDAKGELAEGYIPQEFQFNQSAVKKCRDLIIKDVEEIATKFERGKIAVLNADIILDIINKRFGDL